MSEEINEIYERLLARDYALTLFGDLGQLKKSGRGYMALCPFHPDKSPSFSFSMEKPVFHCFSCGKSGDWLTYLMEKEGLEFKEALDRLAKEAGVELRGHDREAWERDKAQANAWETAGDYFRTQLWEEEGRAVRDYLAGRGYSDNDIRGMELGLFTSAKELSAYLKSKGIKEAEAGPVLKALENITKAHKVVIAYRDPAGRIQGFIVRATAKDIKPKYLYTLGLRRDAPFGLDRARRYSGLIVVEGYLDALAIREKTGLENIIALGDTSLSETKLDHALKYGAKAFTLALDNDKAGADGTERALELLRKRGLRAYVLTLPDGIKDPDEFIKATGLEAFIELTSKAQSGARWKAGQILSRHEIGTDRGRDQAIEEAISYDDGLIDQVESKDLWDVVTQRLGLSPEFLEHRQKSYKEKIARERINKNSQRLLEEALGKLKTETGLDIRDLEDRFKDLRLEAEKIKALPTETLSEHLLEKQKRESTRRGTELLGYELRTFREIAKKTDGIQSGFYIIGAYTSKGKTALATNLFLDLLLSNPGTKGLYFSLDDNRDVIINRFLGILTGIELNRVQRKQEDPEKQRDLEEGYRKLVRLAGEGRLFIKDISEVSHVDTLEIEIRERAQDKLFVVIDGLYNLETGSDYSGIREENIERANKVKALVDTYKIPIICTGELRKKTPGEGKDREPTIDDLMETGKFAYNANLVWLLYPFQKAEKKYEENPEPVLTLKYEKNKLSYFAETQLLIFKKATGAIMEKMDNPFE